MCCDGTRGLILGDRLPCSRAGEMVLSGLNKIITHRGRVEALLRPLWMERRDRGLVAVLLSLPFPRSRSSLCDMMGVECAQMGADWVAGRWRAGK